MRQDVIVKYIAWSLTWRYSKYEPDFATRRSPNPTYFFLTSRFSESIPRKGPSFQAWIWVWSVIIIQSELYGYGPRITRKREVFGFSLLRENHEILDNSTSGDVVVFVEPQATHLLRPLSLGHCSLAIVPWPLFLGHCFIIWLPNPGLLQQSTIPKESRVLDFVWGSSNLLNTHHTVRFQNQLQKYIIERLGHRQLSICSLLAMIDYIFNLQCNIRGLNWVNCNLVWMSHVGTAAWEGGTRETWCWKLVSHQRGSVDGNRHTAMEFQGGIWERGSASCGSTSKRKIRSISFSVIY